MGVGLEVADYEAGCFLHAEIPNVVVGIFAHIQSRQVFEYGPMCRSIEDFA